VDGIENENFFQGDNINYVDINYHYGSVFSTDVSGYNQGAVVCAGGSGYKPVFALG
jgi:hypothetical protein